MIISESINSMKNYYKTFMQNEGRLTFDQEKSLDSVQIKFEPLNILSWGYYNIKNHTIILNSNYKNNFLC